MRKFHSIFAKKNSVENRVIITCLIAVKNPCGLKKPVIQKTCSEEVITKLFISICIHHEGNSCCCQRNTFFFPFFNVNVAACLPLVYREHTKHGIVRSFPTTPCTRNPTLLIPMKSERHERG